MKHYKFMKYCPEEYELIENYDKAKADNFKGWVCHHINGEVLSREDLIEMNLYYNVPYYMLKFVTDAEHRRLHIDKSSFSFKGHHHTKETKAKIIKNLRRTPKGNIPWNKGLTFKKHKETKWKLSEETKKKHSEVMKQIWLKRKSNG